MKLFTLILIVFAGLNSFAYDDDDLLTAYHCEKSIDQVKALNEAIQLSDMSGSVAEMTSQLENLFVQHFDQVSPGSSVKIRLDHYNGEALVFEVDVASSTNGFSDSSYHVLNTPYKGKTKAYFLGCDY